MRQPAEGAPERAQVGPARDIAEQNAQDRAGPGEEKVAGQARPLVNILPAEEDEVFLFVSPT